MNSSHKVQDRMPPTQCNPAGDFAHLGVALLAELEAAVQCCGVPLHLVPLARRRAPEQVERGARRQQPLVLLPAAANRAAPNYGMCKA